MHLNCREANIEFFFLKSTTSKMQGNVTQDTRFASLKNNGDLAELVVTTKKHISHPLVYGLIKLALTLPVATAIVDVNWCFSAMKIVKQ